MPRKKLSEYKAKTILGNYTGNKYEGTEYIVGETKNFPASSKYVVKVDQAIKRRGKQGLIKIVKSKIEAEKAIRTLSRKGFNKLLIEPFIPHQPEDERYLSIRLVRNGLEINYNPRGGIEVEGAKDTMLGNTLPLTTDPVTISKRTNIPEDFISALLKMMEDNYFSFIELNPIIVEDDTVTALDMAVEVDDAGAFFIDSWNKADFRFPKSTKKTTEEVHIEELNSSSQASFRVEVLNPNGSVFMLLSGGGASVTLADEIHNKGQGEKLANYGEYSGAPNREETRYYTQQLIGLLLKSNAKKKVLIIAGGVANFTDVLVTFAGIIDALKVEQKKLLRQKVKVYVRRGGPNEVAGLKAMEAFLKESGLLGVVHGSDVALTDIIEIATKDMR